jgi:glycosyltransferase involved in cell wall biosynthesis
MHQRDITILMATYNSERYVGVQIESLLAQTYMNWDLIVRDDNSTDQTVKILKSFSERYPGRIKIIEGDKNVGACQNFAHMMALTDAEYVMFCDSDDVWLPNKIEITLKKIQEMEDTFGSSTPLLVHTDLQVVDRNINTICKSFWSYQNINAEHWSNLNQILIRSNITGCTILMNQSLKVLSGSIPCDAIMHDWWIALVAAAFGKIGHIKEQTILYRQHEQNDIGAKKWSLKYVLKFVNDIEAIRIRLKKKQLQARAFLECYENRLQRSQIEMLRIFATLMDQGFIMKRYYLFKHRFFDMGLMRNIGMFVAL